MPIKMYNTLDEHQIRMLSKEEAQRFISMLKAELEDKELYKFGEVSDGSATFEPLRHEQHSKQETTASEYVEIENLVFKLEAVAVYQMNELHAIIDEFIVEQETNEWTPAKRQLRTAMVELIQNDSITFEGMIKMVENNPTAFNILLGVGL